MGLYILVTAFQIRGILHIHFFLSFLILNSIHRSPSPKTPPPFDLRMTSTTVGPGTKPAIRFTPTRQSSLSLKTLSRPHPASVSLAQKKGPLPPIPSNTRVASSGTGHNVNLRNLSSSFSIPLPPLYPAPKINPAGVRKSASFAPVSKQQFYYVTSHITFQYRYSI